MAGKEWRESGETNVGKKKYQKEKQLAGYAVDLGRLVREALYASSTQGDISIALSDVRIHDFRCCGSYTSLPKYLPPYPRSEQHGRANLSVRDEYN